ncbi:hypothetical protein C446_11055 [Halobiforma nitratireducens JCM 10879]|uniref:Uncharacterized protein n=1 Tax=Halobiforma nitratireducens JCM 10879 TaxID=1227454 RepID=M0LYP9_9EURY|nr:hypothetical protein C446_11055 [Halobiforma nitratireducens JCM 10879]
MQATRRRFGGDRTPLPGSRRHDERIEFDPIITVGEPGTFGCRQVVLVDAVRTGGEPNWNPFGRRDRPLLAVEDALECHRRFDGDGRPTGAVLEIDFSSSSPTYIWLLLKVL